MKLNKKFSSLIIIVVAFVLSTSIHYIWDMGQTQRVFNTITKSDEISQYNIEAEFNEESMEIYGNQQVYYKNNTNKNMKEVYFHIYANAFKSNKTAPFESKNMTKAYPNGFDKGGIEILSVTEGGKKVNYKIMGEGDTTLRVTPKTLLESGTATKINIEFKVKLPNSVGRMGYGENTVNIANWYPILSIYDNNGWNLEPYYAIGDPFYSDVAEYNVKMSIPKEYELATTGNILKKSNKGNKKIYDIKANNVRDFTLILSQKFSINRGNVDDTEVISYTIDGKKEKESLKYSMDALKIFNRSFGKYPYDQLSVVASDFFIGGMEYPNLVVIGKSLYENNVNISLEYVIAHEIAHQWWYGIIGNNQVIEPWLDEALTEYSTLMYFEKKYGDHIKDEIYEKMIENNYQEFSSNNTKNDERILRSLKEFDNSLEYSSIVYSKGAMFIKELKDEMGEDDFIKGLREYFGTYKFKNATTEDFYKIMQSNTNKDLKEEFHNWLGYME